jgi:hypothetical protein
MSGFKRQVFYIGGFDPRGSRFYRELMRTQLDRYAERTGERVVMATLPAENAHRSDWSILNRDQDAATLHSFLRWEDIVHAAWIRNPLELARRAARAYYAYFQHLDRDAGRGLPKGPLITLVYPPIVTIALPLLLALPAMLVAAIWLPMALAFAISLTLGIALSYPLLRVSHATWLLRFFVFNSELGSGGTSDRALDSRLDLFAGEIAAALDNGSDEILLVTHSNGSILAVPVMARLMALRGGTMPANFALITYGQCIPLVACRRDATGFHDQLRVLAKGDFRWFDIGSPPDGAAFHGVNPLAFHAESWSPALTLLSPRFHRFYAPETYHKGWHNKYEIHFDYLRVGDLVSPLDLPTLVASHRTIDQAVTAFREIP